MSEKPKRKNDEPIPRRYWWIFGILAILLLITLPFPIRILYWWELNSILYGLIALACLLATVRFIQRFHWKRRIVIMMLICNLLVGFQTYASTRITHFDNNQCESVDDRLITWTYCEIPCLASVAGYVSIGDLPIAIEMYIGHGWFCSLF
jgi:hypothetical protein